MKLLWPTWAFGTITLFGRLATAHVVSKLQQFFFAELAIFVGIELHRVFEESFWVMWRRTTGTIAIVGAATITTSATRSSSRRTTTLLRTTGIATTTSTGCRTVGISSAGSPLCVSSRSTLPRTTTSIGTATTFRATTGLRSQFLFGQLAVFVLVERQQCGSRVLQFVGRDHTIVIGVQSLYDRHRWTTAAGATLSAGTTWASARCSSATG